MTSSYDATPAFPMAPIRALGSIIKNWPMVVPVLLCARRNPLTHSWTIRKAAIRRKCACALMLFDDRELSYGRSEFITIHMVNVESRSDLKIIFRPEIPRYKSIDRTIVVQRLDEFSSDCVNANDRICG